MITKPESPCRACPLYGSGKGFVPADGEGTNGVLIILEAAGAEEEVQGRPTVGKAGLYLWTAISRLGLKREEFRIHNVLSCRPPENKLAKMPYEAEAISRCSPLLDATIQDHVSKSKSLNKTPVIVALGRIAFKRIMNLDERSPILREDYIAYPFWSERYQCWVMAADHPAYLMRGNHHLLHILQFVVKRAVEIASEDLELESLNYLLDPSPAEFQKWADEYVRVSGGVFLSYDIETLMKQGGNEEEVAKEDDSDYTILRVGFCYTPGNAVSIPWKAEYLPAIQQIFRTSGAKVGWNNNLYDDPRIKAQLLMNGDLLDAMQAWHVLNSALPKGLGFVTPFYWQNTGMWKHLSAAEPAFYNAKDADAALRNWIGIKKDLEENGLWEVFKKHVIEVSRIFTYMSIQGVELDQQLRLEYERSLSKALAKVEAEIDNAVPINAREHKLYKKAPKNLEGIQTRIIEGEEKVCLRCGEVNPKKPHFRILKKKPNPCAGSMAVPVPAKVTQYYKVLPFKISKTSLERYQKAMRHRPIIDPKEKKVTFDEKAIMRLSKSYPKDPLYPLILKQRGLQKLLSTYVGVTVEDGRIRGGLPLGKDGALHTTFTRNPETLRSASSNPNLQNIPRGVLEIEG